MTYLRKYVFRVKEKTVSVKVFNMITRIIETETLIKLISCNCEFKFDSKNIQIKTKTE